jgi:uncharacterized protein YndB with AHSA1/START domain
MGHAFDESAEQEVPATPDQVWEAIATGPGLDAWFMGRNAVSPGEGGMVRSDVGAFVQEFVITAWEPAKRLALRTQRQENGAFLAMEWLIEGRDGGATVLRTVASGFLGGEDWAEEYEAMTAGGAMYTHTLLEYLRHFAGRAGHPAFVQVPWPGGRAALFPRLRAELGLGDAPAVGDVVHPPVGGVPEAVVDYLTPRFLGLRTASGLHRFFGDEYACAEHRLFGPDADRVAAAWEAWFRQAFAA